MRVLVTGGAGMLGHTLAATAPPGAELHVTVHRTPAELGEPHRLDLADAVAVERLVSGLRPDVIVHTAYDKTDGRRGILEPGEQLADAARRSGAGLVHLSTDVVFDGEHSPYAETDELRPVSEYGRWKVRAEAAVRHAVPTAAIVRCSLVVSRATDPAGDHLDRLLPGGGLFVDEVRQPIGAVDLAHALWELTGLGATDRAGFWHLAGPETLSRYALGLLATTHRGEAPPRWAARDDHPGTRPRDVRLLTGRADRALTTRPRAISSLLAPATPS